MGVRDELHEALDVEDFPSRALLAQTMAGLGRPPARHVPAAPAVAAGLIASALVLTLVAINLRPQSSAGSLPVLPTVDNLVSVQFVSPQVGWVHLYAAGDVVARSDVIARTADGGKTWQRVLTLPGPGESCRDCLLFPPTTMQAIDAQNAVLFGWNMNGAVIWETADGGAHWRSQVVATDQPNLIGGVAGDFVDPRHGWLLLDRLNCGGTMACPVIVSLGQVVYGTEDGGRHWTNVGFLSDVRARMVTVDFVNQDVGIAVGGGVVAATHDGGRTWKSTDFHLPQPACGTIGGCVFQVADTVTMFDDTSGVLVISTFDQGHGYTLASRTAYATYDGAVTWTEAPILLNRMEGLVLFLGFNMVLNVTPESVALQPGWYLDAADFVDAKHGWVTITDSPVHAALGMGQAVGDHFRVLATSDGGVTWRAIALPKV